MQPIQIVLLSFILLALILLFCLPRKQLLGRLFFLLQFIAGGLFVLFPDLSTRVALLLGVGRGTDLLLYFLIVLFYLTTLLFLRRIRLIEQKQTEILREIALLNAKDNQQNTGN